MATPVDTLLVRIETDMKGVREDLKRLERRTQQSTNKMNNSFSKVGKVVKLAMVAVAVKEIARMGLAMVNLASDAREMQNKSSVVFGIYTKDLRKWADDFGKSIGRSKFELEEMAASVQDTFVPMGFARKEGLELSKTLTKLAVDVASFNNKADAEVMRAFKSALVGNHETLRQFGVVITEATLKQELLSMGIEGGTKAATEQEKVQARLNLLLAGTSDAQGDAARTVDDYASKVKAMQAALKDLGIGLGQTLIPIALEIVDIFTNVITTLDELFKKMGIIQENAKDTTVRLMQKNAPLIEKLMADNRRMGAENVEKTPSGSNLLTPIMVQANQERMAKNVAAINKINEEYFAQLDIIKKTELASDRIAIKVEKEEALQKKKTAELEKQNEHAKMMEKLSEGARLAMLNLQAEAQLAMLFVDNLVIPEKELPVLHDARLRNKLTARAQRELKEQREANEARGILAAEMASGINPQGMPFTPSGTTTRDANFEIADARTRNKLTARARREFQQMRDVIAAESTKGINRQGKTFTPTLTEREKIIIQRNKINLLKEEIEETMKLETAVFNMTVQNGEYGKNELFGARIQKKMHELRKQDIEMTHGQSHAIALLLIKQEDLRASQAAQIAVFEAFKDRIKEVGDQLADSLAQAFMDGKLELSSFGNIFRSFIQDMIAQVIKLQVIAPIFDSFFGNNTTGGSFIGKLLTGASGGTMQPNRPHLVGERGAELFVPSGAGTLLNNMNTKNAMSGASTIVNQSINLSTGVAQTVHAEVLNLLPAIKEQTLMAVSDSKRRGGSFGKVMG